MFEKVFQRKDREKINFEIKYLKMVFHQLSFPINESIGNFQNYTTKTNIF